MLYTLCVHDDAVTDLDALGVSHPNAAARIAVVLQEIQGDQALLDSLTDHGFGKDRDSGSTFNVSKWQALWNTGLDLWRLRIWDVTPESRVIYAFVPQQRRYYVLGILPREFNYDLNDERSCRIVNAYREITE